MTEVSDKCVRFSGFVEGIIMSHSLISNDKKIAMIEEELKKLNQEIEEIIRRNAYEFLKEE